MGLGLRAIGSALAQVLTHVTASLLGNLVAILLSVPLIVAIGALAVGVKSFSLVPLGVAFLIGVLPNPCTAGVQVVAHELATGEVVTFGDYWKGLRRYARLATLVWLLSLIASAVMLGNIIFYVRQVGSGASHFHTIAGPLLVLWVLVFVIWISIHLYVFPLLVEQEIKNIWLIYRNAALMVLSRPGATLVVVPVWLAILIVSSATGLATLLGLALGASIQHNATAKLLPTFRMKEAG